MSGELARVASLTRVFDRRVAVSDVSFTLHAGEILALLGPNGAGKTTTLRMLAGLIKPSRGAVIICGVPLTQASADRLRHSVGLLTESSGLWDRLSLRRNLLTYARLHGLGDPAGVVDRALDAMGLRDRAEDLAGTLSKGLRQRIAIARALLHTPLIVLLDEPTAGLDPASARHVRELIRDLRRKGCGVLLSTHNLSEAEELADRIAVLNTRLLALDAPSALRHRLSRPRVAIEIVGPAEPWISALTLAAGEEATALGTQLLITLADQGRIPDVVARLACRGAPIRSVTPEQRTLEEVYLTLVSDRGDAT